LIFRFLLMLVSAGLSNLDDAGGTYFVTGDFIILIQETKKRKMKYLSLFMITVFIILFLSAWYIRKNQFYYRISVFFIITKSTTISSG